MMSRFGTLIMSRHVIMSRPLPELLYAKDAFRSGGYANPGGLIQSPKCLFVPVSTSLPCCSSLSIRNYGLALSLSNPGSSTVAAAAVKHVKSLEDEDDEGESGEEDGVLDDEGKLEDVKEDEGEVEDEEENPRASPLHKIKPAKSRGFQVLGNKEKKELRAYAHGLGSRLNVQHVGKLGVSQTVVNSISDALEANEILKVKVLENCTNDMDYVMEQLEKGTGGQVVGKTGRTVLLYRASLRKLPAEEKEPEKHKYRNRVGTNRRQEYREQMFPRRSNRAQTVRR